MRSSDSEAVLRFQPLGAWSVLCLPLSTASPLDLPTRMAVQACGTRVFRGKKADRGGLLKYRVKPTSSSMAKMLLPGLESSTVDAT